MSDITYCYCNMRGTSMCDDWCGSYGHCAEPVPICQGPVQQTVYRPQTIAQPTNATQDTTQTPAVYKPKRRPVIFVRKPAQPHSNTATWTNKGNASIKPSTIPVSKN